MRRLLLALALVASCGSLAAAQTTACTKKPTYAYPALPGQPDSIALRAATKGVASRIWVEDTTHHVCLGYVAPTSTTPRTWGGYLGSLTTTYARTADSALAVRDSALAALLGRLGVVVTPPPPPPPPPVLGTLALAVGASSATIATGASGAVSVTVTRPTGFTGAVTVDAHALPSGVTATPATIATGATTGAVTLSVASGATPGSTGVWLVAAPSVATPGIAADSQSVTLTIPAPPVDTTTPPATGSGTSVTLAIRRYDGGSGAVAVSNGIPLPPGWLTTSTLDSLHVTVGGVEVPSLVRALGGRHPDSTLRAVLVQFTATVPDTNPVAAALIYGGGPRTLAAPTYVVPSLTPVAAALPTDTAWLMASRWGGNLTGAGSTNPTPLAAQYEADYVRLEAADWTRCGAAWSCGRTAGYDRALVNYQTWLRTGNPRYWYHGTLEVADYLRNYIIPNQSPTPWWDMPEGVAVGYWATGSDTTRYQLRKIAETVAWQTRAGQTYWIGGHYGDDRMRAKAFLGALAAHMIGIDTQPADASSYYQINGGNAYYAQFLTPSTLGTMVSQILATQRTNGQFGGSQYSGGTWSPDSGGQSNYMVGMLLTGLIRYYEEINADARIPVAVKRWLDDAWAREWWSAYGGFQYNSLRGTTANTTTPDGNPHALPGLNGLMTTAYAWYAAVSGNSAYAAMVDTQLAGLAQKSSRDWWAASGKAFDEAFYRLWNTLAWRAGKR